MYFSASSAYTPKEVNEVALHGFSVRLSSFLPNAMSILYGGEWSTGTIEQNASTGHFFSSMEQSRFVTLKWRNGVSLNLSHFASCSWRRINSPLGITSSYVGDRYRFPYLPCRTLFRPVHPLSVTINHPTPLTVQPSHPATSHADPALPLISAGSLHAPHLWPAEVPRLRH